MAIIPFTNWPGNFGTPRVEGHIENVQARYRRVQPVQGAARYRRKSIRLPKIVTCSFWFTPAQLEAFERFYYNNLQGGAIGFNMPLWTTYGLFTHACRMGPYRVTHLEISQAVQVDFEIMFYAVQHATAPVV